MCVCTLSESHCHTLLYVFDKRYFSINSTTIHFNCAFNFAKCIRKYLCVSTTCNSWLVFIKQNLKQLDMERRFMDCLIGSTEWSSRTQNFLRLSVWIARSANFGALSKRKDVIPSFLLCVGWCVEPICLYVNQSRRRDYDTFVIFNNTFNFLFPIFLY